VQKVLTPPPISTPRWNRIELVTSFRKVLAVVFDNPIQSFHPVLENTLELLKSDTVKQVCQSLETFVSVNKTLILQCDLGSSEKPEVTWTEIR
jgi:hypothetical protein